MNRFSLRTRLVLGLCVLAAAGLVAADVATYTQLRSFLVARVDGSLHRRGPGDNLAPPGGGYQLRAGDGRQVLEGLGSTAILPGEQPVPDLPAVIRVPATPNDGPDRASYFTVGSMNGGESFRVRASIGPPDPMHMLILAAPLGDVTSTLHRLFIIELLVTALVLATLVALALWVVRLGLRPLRAIEATAVAITAGDLSRRVEKVAPKTEVGRVGGALNTMLDRIEASDRRLRRFVADASHELRTPLTAVRAYAELFGRGAATRPEDLERSMTGITREAERMSLLVDDLLLLARLDEGRPLEREPVDLAALVGEAVDAAKVVEPDRPIAVALEPAAIVGDHDRLRQVLDNLFANVRAHTPPGAAVSVELRAADGVARLAVADRGPGLIEEHAARIFERFYRVDSSRSRASGGVGLGLSIVAAVVEAHGGSVATEPTDGGGATFVLTLPLA